MVWFYGYIFIGGKRIEKRVGMEFKGGRDGRFCVVGGKIIKEYLVLDVSLCFRFYEF